MSTSPTPATAANDTPAASEAATPDDVKAAEQYAADPPSEWPNATKAAFIAGIAYARPPALPVAEAGPAEGVDKPINDDVFEYSSSSGFAQCISGFGRNAIEAIEEDLRGDPGDDILKEARERLAWHIGELVRWCRGLNRQAQERAAEVSRLRAALDAEHTKCGGLIDRLCVMAQETGNLCAALAAAEGERDGLGEALAFYADRSNYDRGARARAALAAPQAQATNGGESHV